MNSMFETVDNLDALPDLISDSDGVITDFSSAFHSYMSDVLGLNAFVNEPSNFDYSDAYPSYDSPSKHINEFINNPKYFGSMRIYPEAKLALKKLHSSGVKITIVTSIGDSLEVQRSRLDLYNRELNNIVDDVIFLPQGGKKHGTLELFPCSFFVDDLVSECESANAIGHTSFLFPRKYNPHMSSNIGVKQLPFKWYSLPYFNHQPNLLGSK